MTRTARLALLALLLASGCAQPEARKWLDLPSGPHPTPLAEIPTHATPAVADRILGDAPADHEPPSATPVPDPSRPRTVQPDEPAPVAPNTGTAPRTGAPPTPTPWGAPTPIAANPTPVPSPATPIANPAATPGGPPAAPDPNADSNAEPDANPPAAPAPGERIPISETQFVILGPAAPPTDPDIVCADVFVVSVATATIHAGPGPDFTILYNARQYLPLPVVAVRGSWLQVSIADAAASDTYITEYWIASGAGAMGYWCRPRGD